MWSRLGPYLVPQHRNPRLLGLSRLRPLGTGLDVSTPTLLAFSDFGLSLRPFLFSTISHFHVMFVFSY